MSLDTSPAAGIAPQPLPVTADTLTKWGGLLVGAAVSVAVSAFGWGVAWASFTGRVEAVEVRVERLEQKAAQPELENRLARIEQLVGQLVCLDERADKELCRQALSGRR